MIEEIRRIDLSARTRLLELADLYSDLVETPPQARDDVMSDLIVQREQELGQVLLILKELKRWTRTATPR